MNSDAAAWMTEAIRQARAGIAEGQSPFGAAIVRDGQIVAAAHNEVWKSTDPTAHAEVVAIRRAAKALASIDLSGCEMFTTCEPCPMCAAAIHWSRISRVYYGATIADAQAAGFNELTLPIHELYLQGKSDVSIITDVAAKECAALFAEWKRNARSRAY